MGLDDLPTGTVVKWDCMTMLLTGEWDWERDFQKNAMSFDSKLKLWNKQITLDRQASGFIFPETQYSEIVSFNTSDSMSAHTM